MAELEALFIHEYHHFTRMEKLKKPMHEYTLLDSLIMEGLAEHAVLDYCGSQYLRYPEIHKKTEELHELWEKLYKKHLHVKKSDPLHEKLLNGTIYSTPFLGYIIGFYLVSLYREKLQNFTINNSFTIPAEAFIPNEQ